MQNFLFVVMLLIVNIGFSQENKWGWNAHRYINEKAVDFLPPEMSYFASQKNYLREHSVDPDQDGNPGYYHYIDIDVYPEFFNGTLPHQWQDMIALYGYNTVINNGTVPWVIEQWSDSLRFLMEQGEWTNAWQIAAELGHYVADSHQPLHLTENYNGQMTGNYGIHSRYETTMISPYLASLPLPTGSARDWPNPLDSVFAYIDVIYPYVDDIMAADDMAYAQDPAYGSVYYSILWQQLQPQTTAAIQRAILDLASIWYTTWIDAGSPDPTTGIADQNLFPDKLQLTAYPNPFNSITNIQFQISGVSHPFGGNSGFVTLRIYNSIGQLVRTLASGNFSSGSHTIQWDGKDNHGSQVASGIFIYRLQAGNFSQSKKMIVLK